MMKKARFLIIAAASMLAAVPAAGFMPAASVRAEAPEMGQPAEEPLPLQVYTGITVVHEKSETTGRYAAEATCPQVFLDGEGAAAYPELAAAFDLLNEQKRAAAQETCRELLVEAEERLREDPDYDAFFTDREDYYVIRADRNIVSLLGVRSGFSGGAHGYEAYTGLNFDPATGNERRLDELVTDGEAFALIVKEKLAGRYPEIDDSLLEAYFAGGVPDDLVWTAGCEGITCWFAPDTLGPHAAGPRAVLVPWTEQEALFTRTGADAPQSFGVEFPAGLPLPAGGREITVWGNLSEHDRYESISICVDGETTVFDEDIISWSVVPAYLKANGEEYLYIQYGAGNDWGAFDIYRLGEKPERIGICELARAMMYAEEEHCSAAAAMSDPGCLFLSRKLWLLDITKVTRHYRVGADGRPEAAEPYFRIGLDKEIRAEEEFSCTEVDEAGEAVGTAVIPAGTRMKMLRTDNSSLLDLRLDDGRVIRVPVTEARLPAFLAYVTG